MRRVQVLSVMALALSMLTAGALYAADAATGSVTGKVVDGAGNPVAGVMVRAVKPPVKAEKGEKREKGDKKEGAAKEKEAPLAETTTAADGSFTLTNVPAGKVGIVAFKKGTGAAHMPAEVTAGQTTTLNAPLTLAKPAEGAGKEHRKDNKKETK